MKTQTLLKSIFVVVFIAVLLPIMSCDAAGNPSALVGRWVAVSSEDRGDIMDLLSDGTGVVPKGAEGVAITWKTESGRFYITASGRAMSWSYKLQGSVLTFTEDNGEISKEYTKCKKDCQEAAKEYVKAKAAALKAKVKKGSFTDSRDGKSYKTVKTDNQTWMAENLNFNAEGSKCYENQESNCQKYGRLYDWNTAMKACPNGWHLPSGNEWQVLVNLVGGRTMLKSSSGWNENGNGMDAIGFSALPGGVGGSDGSFGGVGYYGYWWSASEYGSYYACSRYTDDGIEDVDYYHGSKFRLCSVRCLQD